MLNFLAPTFSPFFLFTSLLFFFFSFYLSSSLLTSLFLLFSLFPVPALSCSLLFTFPHLLSLSLSPYPLLPALLHQLSSLIIFLFHNIILLLSLTWNNFPANHFSRSFSLILFFLELSSSSLFQCPCCAKSFVSHEYVISHVTRRHEEYSKKMNGMLVSSAPIRSVGAVTVESKPGMTEQEKSNLEKELEMIKVRLQKTEQELGEEKKLTESQVHSFAFPVNLSVCLEL